MKKIIILLLFSHILHANEPKSILTGSYDQILNNCELGQIIVLKAEITSNRSYPGNWIEEGHILIFDTKKNEVAQYIETQFNRRGWTKPLTQEKKTSFLLAFHKVQNLKSADLPYEKSIAIAIRSANGVKIRKYLPSEETEALYDLFIDESEIEYRKKRKQENTKTEPNQAPETTILTVTDRAPSSTLRASEDRVSP